MSGKAQPIHTRRDTKLSRLKIELEDEQGSKKNIYARQVMIIYKDDDGENQVVALCNNSFLEEIERDDVVGQAIEQYGRSILGGQRVMDKQP